MFILSAAHEEQDEDLLASLYYEYKERMYASAFAVLGSAADAEDAVQKVFMNIAEGQGRSLKKLGTDKEKRAYLIASVRHAAAAMLRRRAREKALNEELAQLAELCGGEDAVDLICEKNSPGDVVEALDRIGEPYLSALYFHIAEGMSIKDTARLLGRTPSALKQQLVRGKKLLRSQLKEMEGEQNND